LDQRLQVFKEYYFGLRVEQRTASSKWVRLVSAPFPDDFDAFMAMKCDIGLEEDQDVNVEIEVNFNGKTAKVLPQYLRQGIAAWERGEEFAPPLSIDYSA
jgi:hypothetical protein